ncbi:MAG: pyruvate formate-lyase [Clostridia bacterium]|nr:pyruvate formate-lyase [Clostridia bacterium]
MLNQPLYEYYLERKHRAFRKPFDESRAGEFRDPAVPPVRRMEGRLRALLEQETPVILPGQRIVFLRTVTAPPSIFSDGEWEKISGEHFIHELGYLSNMSADYPSVIRRGLLACREEAAQRLRKAREEDDPEGIDFLESAIGEIDAVRALAARYRKEAEEKGLREIAEVLSRVPDHPAESFYEALQFFRILHYVLWAEGEYHNTAGRFDVWAWPYLKNDLEKGTLTEDGAAALLEDFFLSFNWDSDLYTGVQLGDNGQSMMLGGVDGEGKDVYNPLSRMCLETSYELKLIDPKINLRVSRDTPFERYLEATRLTKAGLGFPQYSNDDTVIPALTKLGYEEKDARNYTVAACWEFIIPGVAAEIVNIGALSYPKAVQKAVYRDLQTSPDYESFLERVKDAIREEADAIADGVKNLYIVPAPFYSLLMDGCVERARDISLGNKYNNYGVHGTGLSTAADSLEAVRTLIFEERSLTPAELIDAMEKDFAGYEALLHRVRYELPKLGDGEPGPREAAAFLMNAFASALRGKRNERGGLFRPGTGSAMFYLRHAAELDASPDGRRKGEPFGTNFSPSLYAKSAGPFSVIGDFTSLPAEKTINGGPLTMEFHSSVFATEEGIDRVARLVKLFIDQGGHQLQLNSINRERLLDAQAHPERYKNLIVRIWGWSAYFVELDKAYQDHLIARQEFDE